MCRPIVMLLLLVSLGSSSCTAPLLPKASRLPSTPTEDQMAILQYGAGLYDREKYSEAIAIYTSILEKDPDNVIALYEISSSLIAQRKSEQALPFALRGAEYISPYRYKFYTVIASIEDDLGNHEKAIALYQEALRQEPNDPLLHFNLGVTYARQQHTQLAISSLERAALLSPNHASSHYLLGILFFQRRQAVPALLALGRFLVAEPSSERAEIALSTMESILRGSVAHTQAGGGNSADSFTVHLNFDLDDTVYAAANLVLSLSRVRATTMNLPNEAAMIAEQFDKVIAVLVELDSTRAAPYTDMVHTQYVPYYNAVQQYGYTLPFVYHIFQKRNTIRRQTPNEQKEKIKRFLQWSEAYIGKR